MKTLLNIIWHFPFLGFLHAFWYALVGLFFCCTVILLPLGLGYLNFARYLLSPFSSAMIAKDDLYKLTGKKRNSATAAYSLVIRILYFPFGLLAAVSAILMIALQFVSIIGIPCAMVWARGLSTIFNPVGKVRVSKTVADEIERLKAQAELGQLNVASSPLLAKQAAELEAEGDFFDMDKVKAGLKAAPQWWQIGVLALIGISVLCIFISVPAISVILSLAWAAAGIYVITLAKGNQKVRNAGIMMVVYFVPLVGLILAVAGSLIATGELYAPAQIAAPVEEPVTEKVEEEKAAE